MEDGDGLPLGERAFEDIHAGLTVFDTDSRFGHAQTGIRGEDDLRRLLPQERHVLQRLVRRQDQQPRARLVAAQPGDAHADGLIVVAGEGQRGPIALLDAGELVGRDNAGVVPGGGGDKAADGVRVGLVRLDRLELGDGHLHEPVRRQHIFITVDRGGKRPGGPGADVAGVARGLRFERGELRLQIVDPQLQGGAVRRVRRAAQDQALELGREVRDGVHIAPGQILAQVREAVGDAAVERRLVVDARRGAPGVLQLLDLAGQLVHAGLAGLGVVRAVAGGDDVVRGHVRTLGAGEDGRVVLGGDDLLGTHNKAGGVVARPGFILCDGRCHQRRVEAACHVVDEIRRDRGKQDPYDDGKIRSALFHTAPSRRTERQLSSASGERGLQASW